MSQYTINLNETQELALSYATVDTDYLIQNFVSERARIAIDEIVEKTKMLILKQVQMRFIRVGQKQHKLAQTKHLRRKKREHL